MTAPAAALSLPPAGSVRYFVLLYCPQPRRRRLQLLFAIVDEIAASVRAGLDHQIAHVRLGWWQEEGERLRRGQPSHPFARELLADTGAGTLPALGCFDIDALLHAAMLSLAQARLAAPAAPPSAVTSPSQWPTTLLPREIQVQLFPLLAQILDDRPLPVASRDTLRDIGGCVHELEGAAASISVAPLVAAVAELPAADLPAIAPLCVWAALAARLPRHAAGVSLRSAFVDNILAWSTARAAARGDFQLRGILTAPT